MKGWIFLRYVFNLGIFWLGLNICPNPKGKDGLPTIILFRKFLLLNFGGVTIG